MFSCVLGTSVLSVYYLPYLHAVPIFFVPWQVFQEVMLSIDNAMEKIHSDATKQGGSYTSEQRASLQ